MKNTNQQAQLGRGKMKVINSSVPSNPAFCIGCGLLPPFNTNTIAHNGRVLLPEGNGWMKQFEGNKMVKPTGIQNYVSKSLLWHGCK